MRRLFVFLFILLGTPAIAQGQDCELKGINRYTDDFFFSASSVSGAVGDVVAVEIGLTVETLHGRLRSLTVIASYDPASLELIDEPVYAEVVQSLTFSSFFGRLGDNPAESPSGATGFGFNFHFRSNEATQIFGQGLPVPLATCYFRIRGSPGESTEVRFVDTVFTTPGSTTDCARNFLYYADAPDGNADKYGVLSRLLLAHSRRHSPGAVQIVPGPPTQTEPPPLPPLAAIYPEAPTPETARITFELTGGVVRPGSQVPLDLYLTSNFDFSGFAVALTFPGGSLTVDRIEPHVASVAWGADHQAGTAFLYSIQSRRRLGAEGERVHVATLHVTVAPSAPAGQITLAFENFVIGGAMHYRNWLGIWHTGGLNPSDLPLSAQVEPLTLSPALLIVRENTTVLGDVNLDYLLDITDPVVILGDLFQGRRDTICSPAADYNQDRQIDISDPIAILHHLFLGESPAFTREVSCDE